MDLDLVDLMGTRPSSRKSVSWTEATRFSTGLKLLWRRVNGLPAESGLSVEGLYLTEVPAGSVLKVVQIVGGCQRLRRLIEIGVYPGAQIEVVSAGKHGPVIVKAGETRLAIGRNLARSVMVELVGRSNGL